MAYNFREAKLKWLGAGVRLEWSPELMAGSYDDYLQSAWMKHLHQIGPPGMLLSCLLLNYFVAAFYSFEGSNCYCSGSGGGGGGGNDGGGSDGRRSGGCWQGCRVRLRGAGLAGAGLRDGCGAC